MNRIIIISIISFFIISCSSNEETKSNADLLKSYRTQVEELNKKIDDIEGQQKQKNYSGLLIPVKVEKITKQPFSHNFTATGELESIKEAFISPETLGQIVSINVTEGEHVKKGQLLAKLNTSIIENTINEVKTQLALAKTIYDKQATLWKQNIGSERQYLETKNNYESLNNKLKTLKSQYNMSIIKSPIDGIIEDIFLKKGELATPGMQFMQIINLNELYVTLKLSEAYLPIIKKGEIVDISFPSFPGLTYKQPIYRVGNMINKQNRTFVVQIKIDNKDGKLKPHLLANVTINDYSSTNSIIVPSIIIKEDMKGSFIYVVNDKNETKTAEKKYVVTGVSYLDKTEILSGITTNDTIITDGYNNVSSGSAISIIK